MRDTHVLHPASGAINLDMWRSLLNMETPYQSAKDLCGDAVDGGLGGFLRAAAHQPQAPPAEHCEQLQGGVGRPRAEAVATEVDANHLHAIVYAA